MQTFFFELNFDLLELFEGKLVGGFHSNHILRVDSAVYLVGFG